MGQEGILAKKEPILAKTSPLVIMKFLMISLTIGHFLNQKNDNTSQGVMANHECPVKEDAYCKMCMYHEDIMSWGHTWCSEGRKGAVKVLDEEANEEKDMGNDKEPMKMCCTTLEEKKEDALLKIKMKE
jgi:hypothetical protein